MPVTPVIPEVQPSPRLDREAYFVAAYQLLAEQGCAAVTVAALCERQGVTKGSFYHHFANTAEFTNGLLACWETTVDQLLVLTRAIRDPARQLEALWPAWVSRPHQAEAALRSWANSNPIVATVFHRVDKKVEDFAVEWLDSFLDDPERARTLAYMWLCLTAGMQQRPGEPQQILQASLEFLRTNLGIELEIDDENHLTVRKMPTPTGRTVTPRRPGTATVAKKKGT